MAATRIDVYRLDIEDRPGSLQEMLAGVSEAELNIVHLAAFSCGEGKGHAYFVPEQPWALDDYARANGLELVRCAGFIFTGSDRIGLGAELVKPLSEAGVNVLVGTATVAEGLYYLLLIVSEEDAEAAERALNG